MSWSHGTVPPDHQGDPYITPGGLTRIPRHKSFHWAPNSCTTVLRCESIPSKLQLLIRTQMSRQWLVSMRGRHLFIYRVHFFRTTIQKFCKGFYYFNKSGWFQFLSSHYIAMLSNKWFPFFKNLYFCHLIWLLCMHWSIYADQAMGDLDRLM